MWADRAEHVSRLMRVSRAGLVVLPLGRLARRYPMMRCDGMHFSSYACSRPPGVPRSSKEDGCIAISMDLNRREGQTGASNSSKHLVCHPKLGVYHGMLAIAVAAAQNSRSLEEEIASGGLVGSWEPSAV